MFPFILVDISAENNKKNIDSIDPSRSHNKTMKCLAEAGIYVLVVS